MLKIYGCEQCRDCVNCRRDLDQANVPYIYLNITENLMFLKKFLKLRDENELFADIRKAGKIGIPCIEREDGTITFEWDEFLK